MALSSNDWKTIMQTKLLSLALMVTCSSAIPNGPDTRWKQTGTGIEEGVQATYAFDSSSLLREGREVTAWLRTTYWPSVSFNPGEPNTAVKLYQEQFDCKARTRTTIAIQRYSETGQSINTVVIPGYAREARPIVPDTLGENNFNALCSRTKSSAIN